MPASGYFAHESSYVDDGAVIGNGSKIWHFSHILPGARIGERCNLGQNVVVMPGTKIGNNVKIQNNVSIYEGVTLEDDVFCGPSCVFTNVMNPRSHVPRKHEYRPTLVKRGSSIGANVVVMPGTRIGNNVKIQNNVSIYEGVTLEDDVFCRPSCVFTNVMTPRSHVSRKNEYLPTLVR